MAVLVGVTTMEATKPIVQPPQPQKQSHIDVAFCLDTTGSMSGLIEGAKVKIWSIVNTISTAQPKPVLRIGLVAYRDRGDTYVTKSFDFTPDLEKMYGNLRSLQADGGGDTPEDVNRALNEAVSQLQWSQNPQALRLLFLVGDAPPHMDYQGEIQYSKISSNAAMKRIIINTVQCGEIEGTRHVWQEIARLAEGKFTAIDQSGGMVAINSPYDAELSRLSTQLNGTYIAFTSEGRITQEAQKINDRDAESRAPAAAAERARAKSSPLYRNESWDLVDAYRNDSSALKKVERKNLPAELAGLTEKEQQEFLKKKQQERDLLQKQIQDLSAKRESYVKTETAKLGKKTGSAFDAEVLRTLQEQGKQNGITFAQ
jgi:hypothetical protein